MEIDLSKITLRPFKLEDADDFLSFAGDEQVTRHLRWKTLTSKEEALTHIKDVCIPHPWRRSICIDDRSIGFVSIFPFSGDDRCRANFGFGVAVKYWGHGVATKAVKMAASQFFVDFPGVVRLEAFVDVDNKASQRVVEKAGFQKEGMLRKYAHLKGKLRDLYVFSFLSTDFPTAERGSK
ncbi:GNAT domain - like 10 [Theobroma cacao]|nr:GNAT domain - like 10 [Theobroma cacao]